MSRLGVMAAITATALMGASYRYEPYDPPREFRLGRRGEVSPVFMGKKSTKKRLKSRAKKKAAHKARVANRK